MPWREVSTMSSREEFVSLATQEGANIRGLCRRFGISPSTAYKWLARYQTAGRAGLANRSRRPAARPRQTPAAMEQAIGALREQHPTWGGRKLRARLLALGHPAVAVPAASTITAILHRQGWLPAPPPPAPPPAWERFERAQPNELWQMDFKGHVPLGDGGRCHPLTVLDDHSRYCICLQACANEQTATVQAALTTAFRTYGLPQAMLMDNGAPWGSDGGHPYTPLGVWLWRLGISWRHGRAYHPQTQGKEERFHRTLKAELLTPQGPFPDLAASQTAFDAWRVGYNTERPHEALGLAVPASRYQPSPRGFPAALPPVEYPPGACLRRVQHGGVLHYQGRTFHLPKAFAGHAVELRPRSADEAEWTAFFLTHPIATLDLRSPAAP